MPPPSAARRPRRKARRSVLMIGSEALPFSKTGGLADVLGALPPALSRLGWQATVAVPRYLGVTAGREVARFPVTVGGFVADTGFFEAPLDAGATALLIDCPPLFHRPELYGVGSEDYPDNALRFAFLVRAALEYAGRQSVRPDVLHAHDWQAGLAPVYLKTLYAAHPTLGGLPSVFTIHNLAYQGLFAPEWLPRLDLGWEQFTMQRLEFWGRISFLKGGVIDAAVVTTVSPSYAEEIKTPALGFGFDGILRDRADDLIGVLNGIDTRQWDPSNDPHLPAPFSAKDLTGKAAAKRAVLERYGMAADERAMARPLVGMISRMVYQKGLSLIEAVAPRLPRLDASFVVLGTGEPAYQEMWRRLAAAYPDRFGVRVGFDEPLAHLIEAGADLFLMPSWFEPCGLNQMYSLRYGTVPLVHAVGGLADTVRDPAVTRPPARANGFSFHEFSAAALWATLERALAAFKRPKLWRSLQLAGMRDDYSWDRSAQEYVKIYDGLVMANG